jgi:hypothetical protein
MPSIAAIIGHVLKYSSYCLKFLAEKTIKIFSHLDSSYSTIHHIAL